MTIEVFERLEESLGEAIRKAGMNSVNDGEVDDDLFVANLIHEIKDSIYLAQAAQAIIDSGIDLEAEEEAIIALNDSGFWGEEIYDAVLGFMG